MEKIANYYDLLIENGNDPVLDGEELARYMDGYDGDRFVQLLDLTDGTTVLEIGCGTGRMAKKVVNRCKSYTGIDLSKKTITVAKSHFGSVDNARFLTGDFLTYQFTTTFDTVFSTLTFMHIKNKVGAIEKAYSLINYGGNFVLSLDKDKRDYIDAGFGGITLYPDDENEIRRILEQIGFVDIAVEETELAHIIRANKR